MKKAIGSQTFAVGHGQHVRHQPPMTSRPWVLTLEGGVRSLGTELNCKNVRGDGFPTEALLS